MLRNIKIALCLVFALLISVQVLADVWVDEISAKKGEDLKSFLSLTQKYQEDNWIKVNSKISKVVEAESGKLGNGAIVQTSTTASGGKVVSGFNQPGSYIEWEFEAPARGMYEFWFKYSLPDAEAEPIVLDITVDGKHQFIEMTDIHFNVVPYASALETLERIEPASDKDNGVPFGFIMDKGKHKIRIDNLSGEFELDYLRISGAVKHFFFTQGENYAAGSSTLKKVSRIAASRGKAVSGFENPGDFVEWKVNVPEDGLYAIFFRYTLGDRSVECVRKVQLNGKTIYPDWDEVHFYPTDGWSEKRNDWKERRLEDPETRQPYFIYMPKGEVTIRMEAVSGPLEIDYVGLITRDGEIKGELNFWDYLRLLWHQIISFFISFN